MTETKTTQASTDFGRYGNLPLALKVIFLVLSIGPIGVAVYYLFGFSIQGVVMLDRAYYYLLMACYLSAAYLVLRGRRKDRGIPWYDVVLAALSFGIPMYFFLNAWEIVVVSWGMPSPFNATLGGILCLLVVEAARRMSGITYPILALVIGLYPLFAGYMPGVLFGMNLSFVKTIGAQVFGSEGLVGLPMKVAGDILIGFLLFAGILVGTGAGKFFLDFALALLGRFRGGPAKVSVVSSGLFGMLSGSAISNVISTGCVTIPAMKRTGYPPHYAGAVEAVASSGGLIMPPVMGALAFIMAVFLNTEYRVVMMAAIIPALLYYFGLVVQVDAHAAKTGLRGIPREQLPSLAAAMKEGWPYLFVLVFLVWGLVYMRWEGMAPFYASGLMILLTFTRRATWMTPRRLLETGVTVGRLITQTMAVLLPVGLIQAGMVVTGVGVSFANSIVSLGGGNVFLILLLGAAVCYVMGMAGLVAPPYIFLAVTLAPAVVKIGGLNTIAVHLFIVYWAFLAGITPPVATAAFVGAAMAGASPMKTAITAARLGIVVYFVPFFFVYNPALILQGPILESLYLFLLCLAGIALIASGLEGYLVRVGRLGVLPRAILAVAGFLIALPNWWTVAVGVPLAAACVAGVFIRKRMTVRVEAAS